MFYLRRTFKDTFMTLSEKFSSSGLWWRLWTLNREENLGGTDSWGRTCLETLLEATRFFFLGWDWCLDWKDNKKGRSQVRIVTILNKTLETWSDLVQALIKWVRYWKSLWFIWCCHSWLRVKQTFADTLGTSVVFARLVCKSVQWSGEGIILYLPSPSIFPSRVI